MNLPRCGQLEPCRIQTSSEQGCICLCSNLVLTVFTILRTGYGISVHKFCACVMTELVNFHTTLHNHKAQTTYTERLGSDFFFFFFKGPTKKSPAPHVLAYNITWLLFRVVKVVNVARAANVGLPCTKVHMGETSKVVLRATCKLFSAYRGL